MIFHFFFCSAIYVHNVYISGILEGTV